MKILLVTSEDPRNNIGGMGVFIREFAETLRETHDVKVLLIVSRIADSIEPSGIVSLVLAPQLILPLEGRDSLMLQQAHSIYSQACMALGDWVPDIIHCNDPITYLPFCHHSNISSSCHLSVPDLIGTAFLDQDKFRDLQIEKLACEKAGAFIVYSDYYRNRVINHISKTAGPVKLKLGIHPERYFSKKPIDRIIISFFGRLINFQKGLSLFLDAVNLFESEFIQEYNLEFRLHGNSKNPERFLNERIKAVDFLQGEEKYQAYSETHIVVMPSTYEPFGFVGLEALASGCWLLAPKGLGMDEYTIGRKLFREIELSPESIYVKLKEVISVLGRIESEETTWLSEWNWKKSIDDHLAVYNAIVKGKSLKLHTVNTSFGLERERVVRALQNTPISAEAVELPEVILNSGSLLCFNRFLDTDVQKGWTFHEGLIEFLPYDDQSFEYALCLFQMEFGVNPQLSVSEIFRVARKGALIGTYLGHVHREQSFVFDGESQILEILRTKSSEVIVSSEIIFQSDEKVIIDVRWAL